ncbi:MAG TPA: deoxynucleoside kinase [Schnuerera sp.]|nr:deoxynucleoside kinase [Schnuerera sp.]
MSNIILFGNELNFKTTVAKKLKKHLPEYEIVKGSSFKLAKSSQDELFAHFLDLALKENLIIDRYIWCNLVYADIYKDYSVINNKQRNMIESLLELFETKIYYLYADIDTLKKRLEKRGDEYVSLDKLELINSKYEDILSKTNLSYKKIDTGIMSSDEIVSYILNEVGINRGD